MFRDPSFDDERRAAATAIAPRLRKFIEYSLIGLVVQTVVCCALLYVVATKKAEPYAITQSGVAFPLQPLGESK